MIILEKEEALIDVWCSRCIDLGIPDPTILKGDEYMKVRKRTDYPRFRSTLRFLCLDCWEDREVQERL